MKKLLLAFLLLPLLAFGQAGLRSPGFVGGLGKGGGGGASSLLTGLTGYWNLDEGTGMSHSDSSGNGLTLTDSGTTVTDSGILLFAPLYDFDTPTYHTRADEAAISFGTDTDFTITCWIRIITSTGFNVGIVSKDGAGLTAGTEFILDLNSGLALRFTVGNGTTSAIVTHGTSLSLNTWYFVAAWHDTTGNTLNISVNDGTAASTAWSGGTQNGSAAFNLSSPAYNTNLSFDGRIDEVGFWNGRVLTSGERTTLYNGGTGLTYPF